MTDQLPYNCPEHPLAHILHSWDERHYEINGYPVGIGTKSNHHYECVECGRKLASSQRDMEISSEHNTLEA